jgi:predicted Zn finger-like uncharacterized protein
MRAACPSCEAVYEVPDRLVGAGRRLRCTNCGHEWALLQASAEAAPPAASAPPKLPPAYTAAAPSPSAAAPRSAPPMHTMLRRAPQVIDPPLPPIDDAETERRRGEGLLLAAWIGSALLVALALGSLWTFRAEIAAVWPPAARLVGTPVGGG